MLPKVLYLDPTKISIDENSIENLLPTIDLVYALNSKKNLKILNQSKKSTIELWKLMDDADFWKFIKVKKGVEFYKANKKLSASELFLMRTIEIERNIKDVVDIFESVEFQLESNPRIKNMNIVHQVSKRGNIMQQ